MSISGIIDIAFVAILIILAVIGLTKGFLKSAISMVGSLASAVIAYFAAAPLGKLIDKIFKSTAFFAKKISNWLYSLSEFFSITRNGESLSSLSGEMSSSGVDSALQRLAKAVIGTGVIPEGESVGSVLGNKLGLLITTIIGGIVAFVLIRIIIKVLEHLSSKITQVRIFGAVDKILGFVFGLAKGLLYIGIAFVLMSVLSYIKPIDNKLTPIMDQTKIAQKYYDWVDYNTQEFLNDKFFKKEQKSDKPEEPTPAVEKTVSELEGLLAEINRGYVDTTNSKVYLLVGSEEITDATNIETKAKYYVSYTTEDELNNILTIIDNYSASEGGHTITVDNKPVTPEPPTPTTAEQKELDFFTDEIFATIKYAYIDVENNKVYFKTSDSAIDTANLETDCQYYIDCTGLEDGTNTVKVKIQAYNDANGNTITLS